MTAGRTAVALVATCLWIGPAAAQSFKSRFVGPARLLGNALSDTVARSLPVLSASPGLTFTFDPSSGALVRDTDLLGQVYLERARPIGRGQWNLMLSYQHVRVDGVQGQDLDDLRDVSLPIIVRGTNQTNGGVSDNVLFRYNRYAVDLAVDEVALAATYGITDDLDVNLTLPILASRLSIATNGQSFKRDVNDNSLIPFPPGIRTFEAADGDFHAAGLGDLFLRAKYRFLSQPWGNLAAGLVLRIPTGNQNDFQGTGDWELSPLLYATTRRFSLGGPVTLQGIVNGGVDLRTDDVGQSEGRFGAGIDLSYADQATFSIAFLGREPFHSFAPAGSFDVPRYNPRTGCPVGCNGGPVAPLFGLETVRPSYYALSIGGRVNLWRDTVFGFANVLIPLTDQGIHTDPIPLVGFEATF